MRVDVTNANRARPDVTSTREIAAAERFDYWRAVVCRNLIDVDYWSAQL